MQQLLGDRSGINDGSFFRELFLQRLPTNVRMVLAPTNDSIPLDELAQLADKIVEVAAPHTVSVVHGQSASYDDELDKLRSEVAGLRKLIKSLPQQRSNRPRSPSPARTNSNPNVCWYHEKFGSSARKCKPPCRYSANTSTNVAAVNVAEQQIHRLFHVTDKTSGVRYLVDTGAEVSVIPPSHAERKRSQQTFALQAVNNTAITTYGCKSLTLDLAKFTSNISLDFCNCRCSNSNLGCRFLKALQLAS